MNSFFKMNLYVWKYDFIIAHFKHIVIEQTCLTKCSKSLCITMGKFFASEQFRMFFTAYHYLPPRNFLE